MTYPCPKEPSHRSDDSDYCSICGAKIAGAQGGLLYPSLGSPSGASLSAIGADGACPDCGTSRRGGARFCEICRYNFDTGASGVGVQLPTPAPPTIVQSAELPIPLIPPVPQSSAIPITSPSESPPASPVVPEKWEVLVVVDPSMYTDPDPGVDCPTNEPDRVFPLDFAENLIGRRSDKRDIHPEIPLTDPGISHRHAKILRQPDFSFALLDVGSTNGTHLNDKEATVGVRFSLKDGDQITVGCWTRITLKKV